MTDRPKIITLCGSSRFIEETAVCAWLLERDEGAITMAMHLLPAWYPDCPADHLAEHEGCADSIDNLHLRKIDISDEIFVVDVGGYIGSSTRREIAHAQAGNKRVRFFSEEQIGTDVAAMLVAAVNRAREAAHG